MSKITLAPNAAGTATFTVAAPGTATDRTLTLPDATTTLVGTDTTQTLTNKTIQGGAITLGTAVSSTSGTAIDFTGIPSWAKRVTVMFAGVSTSGGSSVIVRAGTGGVILSSGYTGAIGTITGLNATSASSFTSSGGVTVFETNSLAAWDAVVTLSNLTGNSWVAAGASAYNTSSDASTLAGSFTLSGVLDTIRITTSNGTDTFDAGTVNIMWEG